MSGFAKFSASIQKVLKDLTARKLTRVQGSSDQELLRKIAEDYFREIRPSAFSRDEENELVVAADASAQQLLELSHKKPPIAPVVSSLRRLKKIAEQLDVQITVLAVSKECSSVPDLDRRITTTLQTLTPASANSYMQALQDLQFEYRTSWRGTAAEPRESLRELLDHLAPDSLVTAQPGFKLEQNTHGPTMKQKVQFILTSRDVSKSLAEVPENAAALVEVAFGSLVRSIYSRSNVSTHAIATKAEVSRIRDWVRLVMCELLEIR